MEGGCRGSRGGLKGLARESRRPGSAWKAAGDHGDAARQLRGEEGGADGWARLAARGRDDAGLGAGRAGRARGIGPAEKGERELGLARVGLRGCWADASLG